MMEEIRRLLEEVPFQPFVIVTSSGKQYRVASADHAGFNPSRKRLIVWFDDETFSTVSPLHIVAIEGEAPATSPVA